LPFFLGNVSHYKSATKTRYYKEDAVKGAILLAFLLGSLFTTPIQAMAGRSSFYWTMSVYGDVDGMGIGCYPGQAYDWRMLEDYLPSAHGDDFMDKNTSGLRTTAAASGWHHWSQPGFPTLTRILAAQVCLVHGGYRNAYLYLTTHEGELIPVGPLSQGEHEAQNYLVEDCLDLKSVFAFRSRSFYDCMKQDFIQFDLEIPSLEGSFSLDNGVIDYVKVQAYGS
jgi:hypothetical protein